ncbi:MAG: calcium/sodium antiporter [Woeseiaceae bacterium]|nr:calcium/sodium antiporter [Woeseiaceae bacterium]
MFSVLGILIGLLLLIGGGAALVTGATKVASRMGISPMIIGLTIVGFGTSTPELVVNIVGAVRGETELAFGNVIGSNISNLALVLGAAAFIRAIEIQGNVVRREVPLLLLITTIITVMALDGVLEQLPARIGLTDSVVLLLLFGIFLYIAVQDLVLSRNDEPLIAEIEHSPIVVTEPSSRYPWLFVLLGFVLLFAGGELTVRASVSLSEQLGISTAVIGLFVVAVGTSMPELVTSIIAAIRGESDLALGNIIGSNIFNSLIVLPASGMAGTIAVPRGGVTDLLVSLLLTAILIPIFFIGNARLGRTAGLMLLAIYVAYAAIRLTGAVRG